MKKILITGGSGFIGTNLIESIKGNTNQILNIDIQTPKISAHNTYWTKADICDSATLSKIISDFSPNIVIHLAARTDLNGKSITDYQANTDGVENLINSLETCTELETVIFTSSMYVCRPGYSPKNELDYAPHTIYGESKVITEKIIRKNSPKKYSWCIIRPTSIWGPYFGEPYANFFHIVMNRKYFHMGEKACTKTYGYIENSVQQILTLTNTKKENIQEHVFYIGDWPAYNISEWANEIAEYLNIKIPRIPYILFKITALFGDILKLINIKFPMTSFRLKNMTTNNVHDVSLIQSLCPELAVSRKNGVKKTVDWIKSTQKEK